MSCINGAIYNPEGVIVRSIMCSNVVSMFLQAGENERVVLGKASDATHKVDLSGLYPKLVKKSEAEIEQDKPVYPVVPESEQQANITNRQLADILTRLARVEETQ